jgi:hypothetical protein
MLEILVNNDARYSDFGHSIFQTQHLSNLLATPKDLVIAAAANLAKALETTIPVDLRDSSMKALTDLSALFSEAALPYNNDPATHIITPETVLTQSQQAPITYPRVPPTPMPTPPPRVHPLCTLQGCPPLYPPAHHLLSQNLFFQQWQVVTRNTKPSCPINLPPLRLKSFLDLNE